VNSSPSATAHLLVALNDQRPSESGKCHPDASVRIRVIEQGTSTRVVQVLLGHSNVHTTETYTHVSPSTLGNVVGPLERVLNAATKTSAE